MIDHHHKKYKEQIAKNPPNKIKDRAKSIMFIYGKFTKYHETKKRYEDIITKKYRLYFLVYGI